MTRDAPASAARRGDDPRDLVCFASAFRGEGSDNITHATLDGERTLCGRTGWETSEGWDEDSLGPDCLRCSAALAKREGKP